MLVRKRAMLVCKQERMFVCKHESMHVWVHESMSVWEAHSWSLGVKRISSGSVSFHYRRFIDREAIWNGARAADLDCEFINQIEFCDCKFLNFPWVWNRKIHWMLVFPCWVSRVKYLCQMCMIFCVFLLLCILGLIPMYFQLSFSAVWDCWG